MSASALKSWSLRARVTLFTLAIFLAGIWTLSLYASRQLHENMEQLTGEQQFSTVSFIAAEIDGELGERLHALELVAASISPAAFGDVASLQKLLEERSVFQSLFNGGTFVTDLDGTAIASTPLSAARLGVNYMERDFIGAALKDGKATIGRPVMGKKLRAPVFVMAVPILDSRSRVVGALSGVTNLGAPNFLDKITQGRYGKTGGYLLIAPQYRLIVTASDKNRIMEEFPGSGVSPLVDRLVQGYEGSGVALNPRDSEVLSSSKNIPLGGWAIVASMSAAEAFAPIHDMQLRVLLATIVLTLLAGGLTWWMIGRQLGPMLAAARTLALFSGADLHPQSLPIARQDEVGALVGGFNRLLETLGGREVALRLSEERHRRIVQTTMDGFWLVDTECRLLEVNESYCRMSGYSAPELLVMRIPDLEIGDRIGDTAARMERIIALGEDRFESRHRRKDGSVFEVEVSVQYLSTEGGRFVAFLRDITEGKRAEAQRVRLEAQLRESQKMEALGTLAGGVAHDFNNTLAVISGNVELARQDMGPDHAALESLEEIGKASRQAKDLVQQILAFGRRQKLERKAMSLALVVVETARLVRATLPAMVSLSVDCDADAPAVLADASQMKQILLNLCGNAMHALQQQGRPGVIEVRLEALTLIDPHDDLRPGHYARLTVRDNGAGMDEATRSRIFEPFFTTKPVGKGTGLGLSVVHTIVQSHEASIEVESAPGEGSAFRIYFPAVELTVAEDAASAVEVTQVDGGGRRVLYIDDERAIILLMRRLLERQGYRVSGYTDPRQALMAVRADPGRFDLTVTDYNMPGMTGLEVAIALREVRADLPVVLASGYITEELRLQATAAGVRELIYKPDTVEDLCAAVARWAGGLEQLTEELG